MIACHLQVWYSSTWSSNTLAAFKGAVLALLNAGAAASKQPLHLRTTVHPSADALADPDVLKLLRHWQVANVSLAAARMGWAQGACTSTTVVANFKRKVDRLALCQVLLTGDMPVLGPCDHGSICMFAVPDKFGERALDESFLQVRATLLPAAACAGATSTCTVQVPLVPVQYRWYR